MKKKQGLPGVPKTENIVRKKFLAREQGRIKARSNHPRRHYRGGLPEIKYQSVGKTHERGNKRRATVLYGRRGDPHGSSKFLGEES